MLKEEKEKNLKESFNIDNLINNTNENSLFINNENEIEKEKEREKEKDKLINSFTEKEKIVFYDDLNKIINNAGFNLITYKVIFFSFLCCFIAGFNISFFGNIATAFKQYHKISDGLLSFISSLVFIGMLIGYFTIIFCLKFWTRRQLILISLIGITLSNLIMSLINNIVMFAIFRTIGSMFSAYYIIVNMTIYSEYLPVKFRSFMINIIWCGFNLGGIYFLLFCKVYIPNLSYDPLNNKTPQNFHMAIFTIFYVELLTIIFVYFFCKDSPRNLILNNKLEEAGEILEYYVNIKLTKEELDAIHYNLLNTGENRRGKKYNDYKLLFSRRYLKLTLLLIAVFFLYNFSSYGMNIALPIILKTNESSLNKVLKTREINDLIIYTLIHIPLIPAIISEIKSIGRKYSQIVLIIISIIVGIFALIFKNHYYIFIFASVALYSYSHNIQEAWINEILPTKIRDSGLGIFKGFGKIGAIISQFVFVGVAKIGMDITLYTYFISLIIIIIFICFLPKNEIIDLDSELDIDESSEDDNNQKTL
jgi:MFS family permease